MIRTLLIIIVMLGVLPFTSPSAQAQIAPSWKTVEPACLPRRAQIWQEGFAETSQASCHCPPRTMCPSGIVDYLGVAGAYNTAFDASGTLVNPAALTNTKLPPSLFWRCCPAPVCPAGSRLEGQLPGDGECNPRCPAGTQLAGTVYPADWNCNPYCPAGTQLAGQVYPADGNCNPIPMCPDGTEFAGQPVPANGLCHTPQPTCPDGTWHAGSVLGGQWQDCLCPAGTLLAATRIPDDWNCNPAVPPETVIPPSSEPSGQPADGGDGGGGDCLSGDAQVVRADGSRVSIATLAAGDELEGIDGNVTVRAMTRVEEIKAPLFYRINDLAFLITGDHPIETKKGWKAIDPELNADGKHYDRLEVGDVLVGKDSEQVVKRITLVPQDAAKGAYNIATEGDKRLKVDGVSVKPFSTFDITY